jgi:uncharacterized protein YbjT (DUF2867 family)
LDDKPILVTGATGYVGGRLVPELLAKGYRVKAVARTLDKFQCLTWSEHPNVQLAIFDAMDSESCMAALDGCRAAYYLIHSMRGRNKNFAQADHDAAGNFACAAAEKGLKRIIYLGGLGDAKDQLSEHLRSRDEVATILKMGRVPVTVLRAAMIIGAGSASFEIMRYLVERLPIMITPRWVSTPSQPIAISDVLFYLIGCMEHNETAGRVFDIGGPDVLSYRQIMELYAELAHLPKRLIIPVPVFTPKLSSYWIHLVTPVPGYIAQPLADGLRNPAVCKDDSIKSIMPRQLSSCRETIQLALEQLKHPQEDHSEVSEWCQPHDVSWALGNAKPANYINS